eukprot:TRINITY_DN68009_c0_g1_i7.p1 TRINITY_DN68009_c0_g1~~TRINITY_DN68009_c0_g1_i7.p1  ORF type:complete len:401 (+),score=21.71 TRINITY_DN68009_c0_g1_i7:52-1203(+)
MSDRTEIEQILRAAGLQEDAVQECLTIFTKERITSTVLPRLSLENFRDLGLVMGDRQLLFSHLHPNFIPHGAPPSAPPAPEAVPLCEHHGQPISGLCTQQGCQLLVCNDCASVGDHRTHRVVDSRKGVSLLRSQLERKYKPSGTLTTIIQKQRTKIATLRSQLAKEEEELKKLEAKEQERAAIRTRISQSLSQTQHLSIGPDTLNALKKLHQLITSLDENSFFSRKIRFTEVIGLSPEDVQVTESGRQLQFIGESGNSRIGVIDPTPITSGDGIVEWAVLPKSNTHKHCWVGFGVIPVSTLSAARTSGPESSFLFGWSTNSREFPGEKLQQAAGDDQIMRLRLDCEKATLTLNGGAAVIRDIPFPVHCYADLAHPNNELRVIE